jgi:hypothetical protein
MDTASLSIEAADTSIGDMGAIPLSWKLEAAMLYSFE